MKEWAPREGASMAEWSYVRGQLNKCGDIQYFSSQYEQTVLALPSIRPAILGTR